MNSVLFWLVLLILFFTYTIGLWGTLFSETVEENGTVDRAHKKPPFHATAKRFGVASLIISLASLCFLYAHVTLWTFIKIVIVALTVGYWMWRVSRSLS